MAVSFYPPGKWVTTSFCPPRNWVSIFPLLSIHREIGLLLPSVHREIGLPLPSVHREIGLLLPSPHRETGLLSKGNSHATLKKYPIREEISAMSADDTDYIRTPTAAMLIGKSIRTVHNWLEDGIILGKRIPYPGIPAGFAQKINLLSMQTLIPFTMTKEIIESISKADNCNYEEMVKIGLLFYDVKHYKIAVDWFSYSAKYGNSEAMFLLSECFLKGLGTKQSHAISLQWLGKSSENGNMRATAKINRISNIINTLEE